MVSSRTEYNRKKQRREQEEQKRLAEFRADNIVLPSDSEECSDESNNSSLGYIFSTEETLPDESDSDDDAYDFDDSEDEEEEQDTPSSEEQRGESYCGCDFDLEFEQSPNNTPEFPEDIPIYDGAPITVRGYVVSLFVMMIRHPASLALWSSVVLFNQILLPTVNLLPTSMDVIKKYLWSSSPHMKVHYCKECQRVFKKREKYCISCWAKPPATRVRVWKYDGGKRKQHKERAYSYFVVFDIRQAVKNIIEDPQIYKSLMGNKKTISENIDDQWIRDVYGGKLYKELFREFLNNIHNISFTCTTDGYQPYNRSAASAWPIFLVINELPPEIRFKSSNLIVAGFYVGPTKPNMEEYFKPLVKQLNLFRNEGVEIIVNNESYTCRAVLLSGIYDSPARSAVLGVNYYNHGQGGCHLCTAKPDRQNNRSVYSDCSEAQPRTLDSVKNELNTNNLSFVKYPSPLLHLVGYDMIRQTAVDVMHIVWEGVVKYFLTKVWFNSKYSNERWSLRHKLKTFEKLLAGARFPHDFSQKARSFKHVSFWRAIEFKHFLLYLFVPIMSQIMPDDQYSHFLYFVRAMHILHKPSVNQDDLKEAHELIVLWHDDIKGVYNTNDFYTSNVHYTTHLVQCIEDHGHILVVHCFWGERANHFFDQHVFGTRGYLQQIAFSMDMYNTCSILEGFLGKISDNTKVFLYNHGCREFPLDDCIKLNETSVKIGSFEFSSPIISRMPTSEETKAIRIRYNAIQFFNKALLPCGIFHTRSFDKEKNSCSHVVMIEMGGVLAVSDVPANPMFQPDENPAPVFAVVESFCVVDGHIPLALLKILKYHSTHSPDSIWAVHSHGSDFPLIAIHVDRIMEKMIFVESRTNESFVCRHWKMQ